jgi:branched-chain amino acid transport system permease protein
MRPSRIPWTPIILTAGVIVVTAIGWMIGTERMQFSLTEMLIRMIVVIGIYVFVGNSGVLSFGQVAFMCIGAYAAAWATLEPPWKQMMLSGLPNFLQEESYPFLIAVAGGGALAGVVALVFGAAIMRLSGMAASIATFAFLVIVNSLYSNWDSVTGGGSSIVGVPTVVGPWTALAFAAGAMFVAYFFQISGYGLQLRASRDDKIAARSSGINVVRVRLIGFTVSAIVIGVGGGLYAHFLGILNTETFYLSLTFTTLAMLVVGGIGSLSGAVTGVIAVTIVVEGLRLFESGFAVGTLTLRLPPYTEEIGLGMLVALTLMFRPNGLAGVREIGDPLSSPETMTEERAQGSFVVRWRRAIVPLLSNFFG